MTAAHISNMTIIDQHGAAHAVNGQYTFKSNSQADFGGLGFPSRPTSPFTEQSATHREAADEYFAGRPWSTAEDFEDALFDTYDSEDDYYADASTAGSGLSMVLNHINPVTLPSGAIAVFYQN